MLCEGCNLHIKKELLGVTFLMYVDANDNPIEAESI